MGFNLKNGCTLNFKQWWEYEKLHRFLAKNTHIRKNSSFQNFTIEISFFYKNYADKWVRSPQINELKIKFVKMNVTKFWLKH